MITPRAHETDKNPCEIVLATVYIIIVTSQEDTSDDLSNAT